MPVSRFRTERCTHGLAIGLCEDRTCKGWNKARVDKSAVTRLEAPRCSHCKVNRGDAIPRGPVHANNTSQHRWRDQCWSDREMREAAAEAKRASPGQALSYCHSGRRRRVS